MSPRCQLLNYKSEPLYRILCPALPVKVNHTIICLLTGIHRSFDRWGFTVHLVRHGEVFNPQQLLYGRLPGFGLSRRGREQSRAAAQWLRARSLAALYNSPMQRARETAAILAEQPGVPPPNVDARLNEVHNAPRWHCRWKR